MKGKIAKYLCKSCGQPIPDNLFTPDLHPFHHQNMVVVFNPKHPSYSEYAKLPEGVTGLKKTSK